MLLQSTTFVSAMPLLQLKLSFEIPLQTCIMLQFRPDSLYSELWNSQHRNAREKTPEEIEREKLEMNDSENHTTHGH